MASYDEALTKLYEQVATLTAQLKELTDERDEMLKDLDAAGWPCRLVELPKEYQILGVWAQKRTDALRVLTSTPHIRAYLSVMDPKSLEQAEEAIEVPEDRRGGLKGALLDLRDAQVMQNALRMLVDSGDQAELAAGSAEQRSHARAQALLARFELGMEPLVAREDRINAEEQQREHRKSLMGGWCSACGGGHLFGDCATSWNNGSNE